MFGDRGAVAIEPHSKSLNLFIQDCLIVLTSFKIICVVLNILSDAGQISGQGY